MRMYLSSFRLGDRPERLVELLDAPGPAAVIGNAIDGAPDEVRRVPPPRLGVISALASPTSRRYRDLRRLLSSVPVPTDFGCA